MNNEIEMSEDDEPSPKPEGLALGRFRESVEMFDWLKRKIVRKKLKKRKLELCIELSSINKKLKILDDLDNKDGVGSKGKDDIAS